MKSSNAAAVAGAGSRIPIYVSSDDDEDEGAPSDDYYSSEDIEIQEAILLSLDSSHAATAAFASSSSPRPNVCKAQETPPDHKGKRKLSPKEDNPSNSKKKRSRSEYFDCAICFEKVHISEKFLVRQCAHAFCNTCVGSYVAAKVSENVAVIGCPDPECEKGLVEIDLCYGIIPSELFDRWNIALCEDIVGGDKFYCPFKDCSALLINDGAVEIKETECPHCHRLFCASCRVPWHHGIKCKEFKKLGDDEKGQGDLTLKSLAKKKKWQRCPKCKMYVSRKSGCLLIAGNMAMFSCPYCNLYPLRRLW
ncbi:hypothetical protein PR202_ga15833 [Eleusine coracana subsp. coracana]|uniref:RBR-type E3 ubiquitin transferase n=1 Tax=Eleusine coracana subsp. coracana TaxID=191504 RepID=A0AAV5CL88_ELECO|nr:hypothetical protein PR202_ga15833 [Eleusine coracana subsp. coracana]